MTEERACCTHCRIHYKPYGDTRGRSYGRWICDTCGFACVLGKWQSPEVDSEAINPKTKEGA